MGNEGLSSADVAAPALTRSEEGLLSLQPGRVTELIGSPGTGLTRLGLGLLAPFASTNTVVAVDTREWISPEAAWESGVPHDRLVIVRCNDRVLWPKVAAALLEGVKAMYLEVPPNTGERELRRLAAVARARRVAVAMRPMGPRLPGGVAYMRLRVLGVTWEGADRGHGKLTRRRLFIEASGKGVAGMTSRFEVEDEGTDSLRLVSDVVARSARRQII